MSDSGIQLSANNETTQTSIESRVQAIASECLASGQVSRPMDSSQQTQQSQQSTQQTRQPSAPLTSIASIDVSTTEQNQTSEQSVPSCSSSNNTVNVTMSATLLTGHHSEPPNVASVVSTSMPHTMTSTQMSNHGLTQTQTSQSQQMIVSSSQPQMVSSSQSATQINISNAVMGQTLTGTGALAAMTSQANAQTPSPMLHIHQTPQHTPILQTSVQQQQHNQMSVAMSQLPQVQVIQQPLGATPGTYQFQQVYTTPQQMLTIPGNLTIQNMQFQNQGLSLQIPFTANNAVSSGAMSMPITSIAAKPPIMSKGVAISPLAHTMTTSQHHMLSQALKPNIGAGNAQQIMKQLLPAQSFGPHSNNQTVVISQLLPHQNQHSMQQSILPATSNRTIIDTPKGKPFGMGSVRSSFGNKMLSQPKSPILPASSSISSSFVANSHFKSPFQTSGSATQLIATQTPSGLITNQPQILGSFQTLPQGLTWTTGPQSAHLVSQNGSPIFIRAPGQNGEHMFIQTSSPQIQTVSMATPINVHSSGTTMHVNAAHTQSSPLTATPMAATLQSLSVASNVNTTTTTSIANTSQPTAIAPSPIAPSPNKPRTLRPAFSVATQTATSAITQKQHAESSTSTPIPPKPIAPAKPKTNTQTVAVTKTVTKEQNTTTPSRSTSVAATTQTISQQTHPQSTKTDAANQTTKVSVGTETPKTNNQVSSSRNSSSDANKHSTVKSNSSTNTTTNTNTNADISQPKVNSVAEEVKSTTKRLVEKKDASTGQDSDLIANFFAQKQQHNHQSVQSSPQLTANNGPQNGQIAVLADLNRQDISKQPPQKAIVKPQILTHVIDGYIIQESPNPFPVNGLSYNSDPKSDEKNNAIIPIESLKSSKNKNENSLNTSATSSRNRSTTDQSCLNCGVSLKRKSNHKNKKGKKICNPCAEQLSNNVDKSGGAQRLGLYNSVTSHLEKNDIQKGQEFAVESINESVKSSHEDRKRLKSSKKSQDISNDLSSTKNGDINTANPNQRKATIAANDVVMESITPLPNTDSQTTKVVEESSSSSSVAGIFIPPGGKNPLKWSVQDVYEFVRNLQGCTEYADEFRSQEIDGQALMLLKEDHLMSAMNMKLGPALKICNKINALREDVQRQN